MSTYPIRIAILDLNNNVENQAMRCLREFLAYYNGRIRHQPIFFQVFDVRYKCEIPDQSFDIYLSTGGPGSPFEGVHQEWELKYFRWLEATFKHNERTDLSKKYIFFICHSYQMMCRFFDFVEIKQRRSTSFGVTTAHKTACGRNEPCFEGLGNPFHVADFRDWQTIQPDNSKMAELGAEVLCLEKIRPNINLERAVMGIRVSDEIIGTQFHPEADALGMRLHFQRPEKKKIVIKHHGADKFKKIINSLNDPRRINLTHRTILPVFLRNAINALRPVEATLVG